MRRHLLAVFVACVSIAGATGQALSDGAPYEYAARPIRRRPSAGADSTSARISAAPGAARRPTARPGVTLDDSWSCFAERRRGRRHARLQLAARADDLRHRRRSRQSRARGSGGYYVPFGYDASTTTDADFYMTLRGRLGVLMNGWMLYVTGGYLGADTTVSVLEACDVFCTTPVVSASNSGFRNGWTIGGGFEAAHRRRLDGQGRISLLRPRLGEPDDAAGQRHRRQHLERRDRRQPRARRHQLPLQQLQVRPVALDERDGCECLLHGGLVSAAMDALSRSSAGRPTRRCARR